MNKVGIGTGSVRPAVHKGWESKNVARELTCLFKQVSKYKTPCCHVHYIVVCVADR
jgi:hypothetical protein